MGLFLGWETDAYFARRLKEEDEAELRQKQAEREAILKYLESAPYKEFRNEFAKACREYDPYWDIDPKSERKCHIIAASLILWAILCFLSHETIGVVVFGIALVVLVVPFILTHPRRAARRQFEKKWEEKWKATHVNITSAA